MTSSPLRAETERRCKIIDLEARRRAAWEIEELTAPELWSRRDDRFFWGAVALGGLGWALFVLVAFGG